MMISRAAHQGIIADEVTSRARYEREYRHPEWPGVQSGVTVGIGYDVGYVTPAQLQADWQGRIPQAMIDALKPCCGVRGKAASALARDLRGKVDIPWDEACAVHEQVTLPRYIRLTVNALPNCGRLHPDSLGSLVSVVFNRGASFRTPGDRYVEMRAIHAHMFAQDFAKIPGEIRSMKRLWPDVPGLQNRREREAALFQRGLESTERTVIKGTVIAGTVAAGNEAVKTVTEQPMPLAPSSVAWPVLGVMAVIAVTAAILIWRKRRKS